MQLETIRLFEAIDEMDSGEVYGDRHRRLTVALIFLALRAGGGIPQDPAELRAEVEALLSEFHRVEAVVTELSHEAEGL